MLKEQIISAIESGNQCKGFLEEIQKEIIATPKSIVILDDDPTGTQTVYNLPVVTSWESSVLEKEIINSPVFFILTNSRSLQIEEANQLAESLGSKLNKLSKKHNKQLIVVSRGDSTLRGHYPNEVDALAKGLENQNAKHILAPAFFEGGRYTYGDVHYVKEGDDFIPANETPFAKDNTFGYENANLVDWIVEKYEGKINKNAIESLSIDFLRTQSTAAFLKKIESRKKSHIVVNATSYSDLEAVALAVLKSKETFLLRTSASFVNAITGIEAKDCLSKEEILNDQKTGGSLIVIGSYVPKTSAQLAVLKEHSKAVFLELDVSNVKNDALFQEDIHQLSKKVNQYLQENKDVVFHTSRTIIRGATKAESLAIVNRVSNGVISIIKQLNIKPKYIVAKGGITSSDVATKGLNVQRAHVLGQALKGVPVWKLGNETKFPNMPYIIFPGNVGDNQALYQLTKLLK
ncbi:four-carbon acid sugar kinase family protein [Polaribacter septentrionalilitoris]|uniref:four-carbon acid sugar kinase family protein n=1 Tax=Polaribacter septentrionalilitoris TaxID=2494657 RepID=UPI00135A2B0A|nr:four-carbon acid sugar kinase family protein [Polaribacter septentrionalilitoris]